MTLAPFLPTLYYFVWVFLNFCNVNWKAPQKKRKSLIGDLLLWTISLTKIIIKRIEKQKIVKIFKLGIFLAQGIAHHNNIAPKIYTNTLTRLGILEKSRRKRPPNITITLSNIFLRIFPLLNWPCQLMSWSKSNISFEDSFVVSFKSSKSE